MTLPRYRCHKEVQAAKILEIHPGRRDGMGPGTTLVLQHGIVCVEEAWDHKHHPQEGGYYVIYKDGYASFSPAKAFEDGYSPL